MSAPGPFSCPICQAPARPFLRRSGVPVHQNLVVRERSQARRVTRGELELACCTACGFIFNAAFDPALLRYGEDYDNTQTHSAVFQAYTNELARMLVEEKGVRGCRIVEVGCGKGLFLRRLVEWPGADNRGVGFDPSYEGPAHDQAGRLSFERRFYGPECADIPADVVICRHVIEHVPEPLALLHSVRQGLAKAPRARVFFETPCVEWILRGQVLWDLFYEHCSYFTAASLANAFTLAGFRVEAVQHVFGGQYLWLEASLAETSGEHPAEASVQILAQEFARSEPRLLKDLAARLGALAQEGPVALWGAAAKGATLANLLDPTGTLIACVADLNPNKQGHFIPGSAHPIVAPERLGELGIRTAVLMNPNYRAENQQLLETLGLDIRLVDVL